MKKHQPPTPILASDYEIIEETLRGTARGRWFLEEFASRNRGADTNVLLNAIHKLEDTVQQQHHAPEVQKFKFDLMEMSKAISRTREEIASIKAPEENNGHLDDASEELDAIVRATERATNDILEAAEDIQETAWVLREAGADSEACDALDSRATDVYSACSFQDITGQRTSKVVNILRYLEARVNSMIDIWDLDRIEGVIQNGQQEVPVADPRDESHLLNGPQLEGLALEQVDIDDMLDGAFPAIVDESGESYSIDMPEEGSAETGDFEVAAHTDDYSDKENSILHEPNELESVGESSDLSFKTESATPDISAEKSDPVQENTDGTSAHDEGSDETESVPRETLQASGDSSPGIVHSSSFEEPANTTLQSLGAGSRTALFS